MAVANMQLKPPDSFDFKQPDGWTKWKKRFERFRVASGLADESELKQVNTLLYCLGEEAEDVLTSTNITEDDKEKYNPVMAKFDEFFQVRKNVIFERARFNRRNQHEGESIEQYISQLYSLSESCDYGALKEEMLRDRIVVGIRDTSLSERLQMDDKLTLEKAKKMVRQKEAVSQHGQELRGDGSKRSPIVIERVEGGSRSTPGTSMCTRCGKPRHNKGDRCPARDATCHKCNRKGHYLKQCFSKKVAASTNELSLDTAFLGAVGAKQPSLWTTTVGVGKKSVSFKLDTGAEVTAISETTYQDLGYRLENLEKPSKVLYGPARQTLEVTGQFSTILTHNNKQSQETVFVIRGLKNDLLGLPAITSLQLLYRANSIQTGGEEIRQQFPKVFTGLGTLGGDYKIKLKEGAIPHSLFTARRVALPLRKKVKAELKRMEGLGVISEIREPTQWCAGMVVVPKHSDAVRICVDLKPLNQSVLREVHHIPKVDETLAQLSGSTLFSKIDANSGFWQIPLAKESRPLTTFITPFGRYCFNKLPFGISSAPELFQRRMNQVLEGLDGVLCQMDDVLIFGANKAEHDARLTKVLERLEDTGVTLNPDKCEFGRERVKFLGHIVDREGIRADPDKVAAVLQMKGPTSITELRRFLGMVNQLGKFSPRIAHLSQPLRELLSNKRSWAWMSAQERAFIDIKTELTQQTVLALYDPEAPTTVSADASSYGLGAVLLQKVADIWKPVAYASRSMTVTEKRYAQIEKEALAVTWACDRFADYIVGREFGIETDHKPLVPLLSTKYLDSLPPRVLRFRLRLARYDYTIQHVPGKLLYTADTLSRAPVAAEVNSVQLQEEVESFTDNLVETFPASSSQLEVYIKAQDTDHECSQVKGYCLSSWPKKEQLDPGILPYWKVRSSLTVYNRLLLYNSRIVVPTTLREETMEKIHAGHQGIERCRMRINLSVWWPSVTKQMTEMIQRCSVCARETIQRKEPLMSTPLPDHPWQVVGSDLFELKGEKYLLVVDYFSRYPEIAKLSSTTSIAIIAVLKSIFARHGVPETFRSDNGPQYISIDFSEFAQSYGFQHITSSPRYPQSNGQAERTVQTVKRMLKQATDPYLALLNYRATPFPWCKLSPSELLMGRKLRTNIPQLPEQFIPKWSYLEEFQKSNSHYKGKQKRDFDKRHRTRDLADIPDDTSVWVTSDGEHMKGTVSSQADTPRSYLVDTPTGIVRRNRYQLNVDPSSSEQETETIPTMPRRIVTRSQTGTSILPPR